MATYMKSASQIQIQNRDYRDDRKIQLKSHEIYRIDRWQGKLDISTTSGLVWVTIPGDYDDYLLRAGEHLVVGKPGKVVVQALPESSFLLHKT